MIMDKPFDLTDSMHFKFLRQWSQDNKTDPLATVIVELNQQFVEQMFALFDSMPTYAPKTTERDRACLSLAVSQEREVTEEISTGVEAVLEDLKNAEAALK